MVTSMQQYAEIQYYELINLMSVEVVHLVTLPCIKHYEVGQSKFGSSPLTVL
jgi:hypothetical protein